MITNKIIRKITLMLRRLRQAEIVLPIGKKNIRYFVRHFFSVKILRRDVGRFLKVGWGKRIYRNKHFFPVYAQYEGARKDIPRIISLDEDFAGVDENSIRDMFRLHRRKKPKTCIETGKDITRETRIKTSGNVRKVMCFRGYPPASKFLKR